MAVRANNRGGLKAVNGSWFQSARQRRRHMRRTFRIAADLKLATSVRKVPPSDDGGFPPELVPAGTRSVSVFLVNDRRPKPEESRDEVYIFQAHLIFPRPLSHDQTCAGWSFRLTTLTNRSPISNIAIASNMVGHGVATLAQLDVIRPIITLLVL